MGVLAREEHDVADHDHRGAQRDEDLPLVQAPADGREQDDEEGADDVRRNGVELLEDDRVRRVDGLDDGRQEESEPLHGYVVKQKDGSGANRDGTGHATAELDVVHLVEDLCRADTLGLDASNGKVLLVLRQPAGGGGSVRQSEETNDGQPDGDNSLDSEDHAPAMKATEVRELEDAGS